MVRLSLAIVFADEVALSDPDSDVGATGGRPLLTPSSAIVAPKGEWDEAKK
jgi:hypothetical protein